MTQWGAVQWFNTEKSTGTSVANLEQVIESSRRNVLQKNWELSDKTGDDRIKTGDESSNVRCPKRHKADALFRQCARREPTSTLPVFCHHFDVISRLVLRLAIPFMTCR
jgi:hypothetical protein